MRFDNLDSALGILLGTDDMLEAVKTGHLIMDGAPEFGGQFVTSRQADDNIYVSLLYHNNARLKIRFSDNNLTTF